MKGVRFMNRARITGPEQLVGVGGDGKITFGSGQPDLPPPAEVFRVKLTLDDLKYGLIQGEPDLREVLADQYPDASSESFIITNGASEALDLALRALYKPGAKVLLPKPYYYSYPRNVHYANMEPIYYNLVEGKIDYQDFEDKIQNARAVIINSPSNPTGTVQGIVTLQKVEKLASKLGVYIISDEVYKDLIYVRENYLIKGDHVITINSFSKTYNMCGARVGYIYAREQWLIEKMIEIKTHTSMNTFKFSQRLALAALDCPRSFIEQQVEIWRARRDFIFEELKNIGLDLWIPEGAFYVLPKIDNPNKVMHDLYYDHGVIVYDGAWFGAPQRIRLSYAQEIEKIKEGIRRIKLYLDKEYK